MAARGDAEADSALGYFLPRTIREREVAADVSRRILSPRKMAPTDVGGYPSIGFPG